MAGRMRVGMGLIAFLVPLLIWDGRPAFAVDEANETGRLLMILLDAGRLTVGANQALINDKSKGLKGFTDERFGEELRERFRVRTGVDLLRLEEATIPPLAKTLLPQLVNASKSVVNEAQMLINLEGIGYKGFIPAVFGTAAASRFRSSTNIYLKQTAAAPRNPRNAPDEFEMRMLRQLMVSPRSGGEDRIVSEVVNDGKTVRLLLPLYYDKSCLACHGEPKGERDVSGYPKEGAKEGDLGGVISVKIDRP